MPPKPKQNYQPCGKDDFQTPGYALDIVEKHLFRHLPIWEPCVGEGYLSRELKRRHFNIYRETDLKTGQDFFDRSNWISAINQAMGWWRREEDKKHLPFPKGNPYMQLVTNPPFSLKKEFVQQALYWDKPFAFLMPSDTMFAGWFTNLVEEKGYQFLILLPGNGKRIDFKSPVYGWEWFVEERYGKTDDPALWSQVAQFSRKTSTAQFSSAWFVYNGNGTHREGSITLKIISAKHWTREYKESFWE